VCCRYIEVGRGALATPIEGKQYGELLPNATGKPASTLPASNASCLRTSTHTTCTSHHSLVTVHIRSKACVCLQLLRTFNIRPFRAVQQSLHTACTPNSHDMRLDLTTGSCPVLCRQLLPGHQAAEGCSVQAQLLLWPPHDIQEGVSRSSLAAECVHNSRHNQRNHEQLLLCRCHVVLWPRPLLLKLVVAKTVAKQASCQAQLLKPSALMSYSLLSHSACCTPQDRCVDHL
jgi:hypothetical protein